MTQSWQMPLQDDTEISWSREMKKVVKFGGTSLASASQIKKAADIIVSMTRGLSWNDRDDVLMYFISELLKMD